MKAFRGEKVQEILNSLENQEQNTDLLNTKDAFPNYTLDALVENEFDQNYIIQQPPFSYKEDKYKFINCRPFYQRRLAFYDQLNYIEPKIKEAYLPREAIVELIEEDWKASKILKKKGNCLVTKSLSDNRIVSIFPYFPSQLGVMISGFSQSDGYDMSSYNFRVQSYDISQGISPTKILQIEKGASNELLIRTLYRCFKLRINMESLGNLEDLTTTDYFTFLQEMSFPSEVLECKFSSYFAHQNVFLCNENRFFVLDGDRTTQISLSDLTGISENNHSFEHMDTTSHPSTFLLSNYHNVCMMDIRDGKVSTCSKVLAEDNFRMVYALKHLKDQYFSVATRNAISVYDIRYATSPVFEFNHYSEENPLDIIGFSQSYDPMEAKEVDDVDSLINMANNSTTFNDPNAEIEENGLLYGYSTTKNGLNILFPNKVFSKLKSFKDKFSDVAEKDKYMLNLTMARKKMGDGLSHQHFEPFHQPRALFSTSLLSEDYSIRGVSALHFEKNIIVSVCDNKSNISFQILKEQDRKYQFHQFSRKKEDDDSSSNEVKINEWSRFNNKKQNKVYSNEKDKITGVSFEDNLYMKKMKFTENGNGKKEKEDENPLQDDFDLEEENEELNREEEDEDFTCYNFRPLLEIITAKDDKFESSYKKLKRGVDKKEKRKATGKNELSTSNIFFGSDGFSMDKLEDIMGIHKKERKSNMELAAKNAKPFLLNNNLLKKLNDDW